LHFVQLPFTSYPCQIVASNSLDEQFQAEIWPLQSGRALAGRGFSVAGSIPTSASIPNRLSGKGFVA
jgi:hypothetical protein